MRAGLTSGVRPLSHLPGIMRTLTKRGPKPSGWPPANRSCGGGPGGRAAAGSSRGTQ